MAVLSLRRRGRAGSEIKTRGTSLRGQSYRPACEPLEERLAPGDTILGGILAALWNAGGMGGCGEELLPAPAAANELLAWEEVERKSEETDAPRRLEHSGPRTESSRGESHEANDVPQKDATDHAEMGVNGLTEEAGARLVGSKTASHFWAPLAQSLPRSVESFGTAPGLGTSTAGPRRPAGNRPDGSAGDVRGGDSIRVLHNFDDEDGSYPYTDLVRDSSGNMYGTTVTGGDFGGGTVFQLSSSSAGWVYTVLYSFTGGLDGGQPYGGVTFNSEGNLYGTAVIGGSGQACEEGCGVVYELTQSGGVWNQSVIHSFQGGEDGAGPGGPVSFDSHGNLYGMTPIGGAFGIGTVFELAPQSNGQWTKSTIHDFTGGEDGGAASAGRLLIDENRHIFGVATVGGVNGVGTVFKIEPPTGETWTFTTLYAFKGQPNDGVFPYGGLVKDASGNLYGTTYYGGTNDVGVVYMLKPTGDTWKERVLYNFQGGSDGALHGHSRRRLSLCRVGGRRNREDVWCDVPRRRGRRRHGVCVQAVEA